MITFWERAAHSVNRLFSLQYVFVTLVVSHLDFEDGTVVLITPFSGHCLPSTFLILHPIGLLYRLMR